MTYRQRRLARAERLRGWADSRDAKSAASFDRADRIADGIPFGQPILVGHHSERRHRRDLDRIHDGMRAGFEHADKAASMRSRADNIEHAADHAIYSDDPDAIERLREKLAALEAERQRITDYNKAARKAIKANATPEALAEIAADILDARQRDDLASLVRIGMSRGLFPAYAASNLGGNITRTRQRIAALENPRPTWFRASRRDPEVCYKCDYYKADHTPHDRVPSVLMCPTGGPR